MAKYISCPTCHFQYLPGEIFISNYLVGQPKRVIRNKIGEILGYEGVEADCTETFICENCGEEFSITAHITYGVNEEAAPEDTVNSEFCSIFTPVALFDDNN